MFDEEGDIWHFRDVLFGMNNAVRNTQLGLELAELVKDKNPEAKWVCDTFQSPTPIHLRPQWDTDARSIVYYVMTNYEFAVAHNYQRDLLVKAANMGHPLAQAAMAYAFTYEAKEEHIKWAMLSASNGERAGMYILACLVDDVNMIKAAALNGNVMAIESLSNTCYWFEARRFELLGIRWPEKKSRKFDNCAVTLQAKFAKSKSDQLYAAMFKIGEIVSKKTPKDSERAQPHQAAVAFYDNCCTKTRVAIYAWTIVASKLRVVKDIRIMIAKMIWKTKNEGLY